MGLILLEALAAGLVFILIIWWTMFSGRNKGELHDEEEDAEAGAKAVDRKPPPKA